MKQGSIHLLEIMQKVDREGWAHLQLPDEFTSQIENLHLALFEQNLFRPAAITGDEQKSKQINGLLRNDLIYWLNSEDLNCLLLNSFLNTLMLELKNYFRLGLTHFESHLAVYPSNHFYKTHIDQTATDNKRFFSFVFYLNKEWPPQNGGALVGYEPDLTTEKFKFYPVWGQFIIFKSDIPHEVQLSFKSRKSMTGWFRT